MPPIELSISGNYCFVDLDRPEPCTCGSRDHIVQHGSESRRWYSGDIHVPVIFCFGSLDKMVIWSPFSESPATNNAVLRSTARLCEIHSFSICCAVTQYQLW